MKILILYATLEGQTAKIAESIAQTLRNTVHQVSTFSAGQLPSNFSLADYDAAILGGPIHIGKYPRGLQEFARQHRDWLNSHPTALFTVCMAIQSQRAESREAARKFGEQFSRETQWQPTEQATFAGAITYSQYRWWTRLIMKYIARHEGGSTDTSRDHEYTDWDAVRLFAEQLSEKWRITH